MMTVSMNIYDDISRIKKYLEQDEKRHLPYAIKQTLNELAVISQRYICWKIPRIFDNSINWWTPKVRTGIKVSFASKENLMSAVFTRAHFAYIQEEGGVKYPYSGGNLAVPTAHVPKLYRSSKALKRTQGDKTVFRLGNSIYRRKGKHNLEKLYSLTPQAYIKPRFAFKRMATVHFWDNFDKVFTKWFNYALKTAR